MFGMGPKKMEPLPPTQKQEKATTPVSFTDSYNKEMGKATDKAVDAMYANEQFKEKSKQAVADGTSIAAQKKLGVSE